MDIDAETLFVKFKAQLDSMEQLKHDFADVHKHMEDVMDKFHQHAQENAKKTMAANKEMLDETEAHSKKVGGSLSQVSQEVGNALGINLGKFTTAAGGVLAVLSFGDEMRKIAYNQYQAQALISGAEGVGTQGQLGQYSKFQANMMTHYGGLVGLGSPEEVAAVSGRLLMTPGMGGASNLFGGGGQVEQALMMGRSTGMGSERVAEMFSDMVKKMNVNANNVGEVFAELVEKGKQVGNVNGQYVQTTMNVTSALKSYGVDLDTVANATQHFWHDIDEGKMSVEDFTKAFTVARTSSEGQRAFLATNVFANDPKLMQMFKGVDVITAMQRAGEMLEGDTHIVNGKKVPIFTPEQRGAGINDMFKNAETMAHSALRQSGMKETDENLRYFEQHFLQATTGINFQNLSQEKQDTLFKAFEKGHFTPDADKIVKESKSNEFQQLMRIGDILGALDKGPLQRIVELMQHLTNMFGGFLAGGMAPILRMTGHGDAAKMMEDIVGENVPGIHKSDAYMAKRFNQDEMHQQRLQAIDYIQKSLRKSGDLNDNFESRMHGMDKNSPGIAHQIQQILGSMHIEIHNHHFVTESGRIVTRSEVEKKLQRARFNSNTDNVPQMGIQ